MKWFQRGKVILVVIKRDTKYCRLMTKYYTKQAFVSPHAGTILHIPVLPSLSSSMHKLYVCMCNTQIEIEVDRYSEGGRGGGETDREKRRKLDFYKMHFLGRFLISVHDFQPHNIYDKIIRHQ